MSIETNNGNSASFDTAASLHFQINEMKSSVFGQALKTSARISTSSIFD